MNEIILDGERMVDKITTHKMLKEIFNFPDYYGENLDALWDCITECFINESGKIIWKSFSKSKEYLGEYADKILETLNEAAEEYGDFTIEVID